MTGGGELLGHGPDLGWLGFGDLTGGTSDVVGRDREAAAAHVGGGHQVLNVTEISDAIDVDAVAEQPPRRSSRRRSWDGADERIGSITSAVER
jgi:hypothetical protein